jgi:hypothetical protein
MTILDPFIWVSPITIAVGVGIAYLLGSPPELSLHYLGTMALACFFGNFLTLGGVALACAAYGSISDRRARANG